VQASVAAPVEVATPPTSNPTANTSNLSPILLSIISEKTGYPEEMLEPGMDLEADLGIDSIKRVEIFGAVQEQHPALAQIDAQALGEKRTIQDILDLLGSSNGVAASVVGEKKKLTPISYKTAADAHRSTVSVLPLPRPDHQEIALPAGHIWLLCEDGTELGASLAAKLSGKIVRVAMPGTNSNAPYRLDTASEAAIGQLVSQISQNEGAIGGCIYLHPRKAKTANTTSQKEGLKAAFFLAKHLAKSLQNAGENGYGSFLAVSQTDGRFGFENPGNLDMSGAALTGLTKSLNLEWPSVWCRTVDFGEGVTLQEQVQSLITELHDPSRKIGEVGYTPAGRATLQAIKDHSPATTSLESRITNNSVFLVSGGAKGVTASCVLEMAKNYACKFILLGRSSLEGEEPGFSKGVTGEMPLKKAIMESLKAQGQKPAIPEVNRQYRSIISRREIQETLSGIEQAGGKAIYISADVTQPEGLKKELAVATDLLGPITGLIHGAGRLADKLIENKTEADFEAVYGTKVEGLESLLQVLDLATLEHLVLFSSVAGFYGNIGQTDYALSNELLNRTASQLKQTYPNCHVSSINWGAWDSGMVSPALKKRFEAEGVVLIPLDSGPVMMVNELVTANEDQAVVVIGNPLPKPPSYLGELKTHRIRRELLLEENTFLYDHSILGNPVMPVVHAGTWMIQTCEQLYPDYAFYSIENVNLLKGIVFDGKQATTYFSDVKEIAKDEDHIRMEVLVWSEDPKVRMRPHYKSVVELRKKISTAPLAQQVSLEGFVQTGEEIYQKKVLFHGPKFQGIQKVVRVNPQEILLECYLDDPGPEAQGQFAAGSVNPLIADAQYQGFLVWVHHQQGASCLPVRSRQAINYRPIPFGQKLYVRIAISESSSFKAIGHIQVFDPAGKLYNETFDGEVTISQQLDWSK
ncbi:MAG: SDR family NAD(P)-dependent oxidoreductase, partial [Bacteroidota bacterium]